MAPHLVMLATLRASDFTSTPLHDSQQNALDEWIGMDHRAVLP